MCVATIDGGTTNTRACIWRGQCILGEASEAVGVRDAVIDGTKSGLVRAVRQALCTAAFRAGIPVSEVSLILAAGMLTSRAGLKEIPHAVAPIGLDELANAMVCVSIPEVASQPIWFVPGVKNMEDNAVTAENAAMMDMMRGEEAEAVGLVSYVNPKGRAIFVLPGSHHKYVLADERRRIQKCITTLAGETLRALTFDTILADTVCRSFAAEFDEEAFLQGAEDGMEHGFLHAAFMTRIRGMFCRYTPLQAQNYLLGVVLADDMQALVSAEDWPQWRDALFVVTGKPVMKNAYACLLERRGQAVVTATDAQQRGLSGYGAMELARRRGLL